MDYSRREVQRNLDELKKRQEWLKENFAKDEILTDRINKAIIAVGVCAIAFLVTGMVALFIYL